MSRTLFNFPDADIVLRSAHDTSKGNALFEPIDFSVHRCVLSAASQFFEGLFSLPQPPSKPTGRLPVIPFTETEAVLDTLLRYIYPVPKPVIRSLEELAPALEAAHKYDVQAATDGLRKHLIAPELLRKHPLRVYAIASRYNLEEEARIASTATLAAGLLAQPLHEDLKAMTAFAYHRLAVLHERRASEAIKLLVLPDEVRCRLCSGAQYVRWAAAPARGGATPISGKPPKWWAPYQERAREELRTRPASGVVVSMQFLQEAAREAGCEQCGTSILASFWWFEQLREKIDALPATV